MKRTSRWNGNLTFSAVILCLIGVLSWSDASLAQPPDATTPREASLNDSRSTATPPADAVPAAESSAEAASSITAAALKRHIEFLASDTLQGREAGTQGNYAAGAYLVDQLRTSKLSTLLNDAEYFRYFHPNFRNIFAVIPGSDKKLQSEFILVGAHYDHVGFGNQTNSRGPFGVVHNGADDNASGTAGVLEIAKALAGLSVKPKRSILIAFWDGEEKGLLGSRHFADYPEIPLSQIRFHLNADMIGRLRPDGLEISGWQTATGCRQFLTQQNTAGLKMRFMYSYKPESDHWPFFERRVPSLMLHTGKHEDYHRPSDDTHLLNMEGIRTVSQFMLHCSIAAANAETLPGFRDWSEESSDAFTRLFANPVQNEPSRLGVTYNGTLAKEGTIQLMSVASGSPANLAGLHVGDRVLALNNRPITRSSDFRSLVMTAPTETIFKVK
ncbi:MAG: M20/M25/M40 family metallo-hydrolase, partial [Rhodopirellula sp.]|nr:M20/M25/M40 family metallo-hydrolase [Rhodopirellula sp.]